MGGSKMVHAAMLYHPNEDLPIIDKSARSELRYVGAGKTEDWVLEQDGKVLRNYTTDDLRISIVYRARCFASDADVKAFNDQNIARENTPNPDPSNPRSPLTVDTILNTLTADLEK